MKDKIITAVLLVIMVLNFLDVMVDISLNVPTAHIIEESVIVLIAGLMALYLIWDIHRRTRRLKQMRTELNAAKQQIQSMNAQFSKARSEYFEAVNHQFDDWNLTRSERDVAFLMLKGLSTVEIAETRNTKEKTIRQQASSIYSKSGLEGRYALSAWFFEDILESREELSGT